MKRFWKRLKWVLIVVICLLLLAQFVGSDKSLALESVVPTDPSIDAILKRSCADCHSNNTNWPWYSYVAPVSWFVIGHVNDGRRDLNLSNWGSYDKRQQQGRLNQMCKLAKLGVMPLSSYTPLHPGSRLTAEEVQTLCNWTSANSN